MSGPITIKTPRLELIAGNHEMAEAEMSGILRLSKLLNAEFSFGWPPPENDENTMEWFFKKIYDNPEARGWLMWYFIAEGNQKRTVVGNGGFTGMPDKEGTIECGYSILELVQENGYATEALEGLINWAFANSGVKNIIAKTLADNIKSIKVLTKNGFTFSGKDTKENIATYELKRPVQ